MSFRWNQFDSLGDEVIHMDQYEYKELQAAHNRSPSFPYKLIACGVLVARHTACVLDIAINFAITHSVVEHLRDSGALD